MAWQQWCADPKEPWGLSCGYVYPLRPHSMLLQKRRLKGGRFGRSPRAARARLRRPQEHHSALHAQLPAWIDAAPVPKGSMTGRQVRTQLRWLQAALEDGPFQPAAALCCTEKLPTLERADQSLWASAADS